MKFFRKGVSEIHFLPAVAGASPTRPEITAGENLSAGIATVNGFELTNSPIPTPNLAEVFTPTIPGEDTIADSNLEFNDDDTDDDIRTALAKGTSGVLVMMPYGDTPTKRCEVWKQATSTGVNDIYSTDNTPAKFRVAFSIGVTPNQNGVIPA